MLLRLSQDTSRNRRQRPRIVAQMQGTGANIERVNKSRAELDRNYIKERNPNKAPDAFPAL